GDDGLYLHKGWDQEAELATLIHFCLTAALLEKNISPVKIAGLEIEKHPRLTRDGYILQDRKFDVQLVYKTKIDLLFNACADAQLKKTPVSQNRVVVEDVILLKGTTICHHEKGECAKTMDFLQVMGLRKHTLLFETLLFSYLKAAVCIAVIIMATFQNGSVPEHTFGESWKESWHEDIAERSCEPALIVNNVSKVWESTGEIAVNGFSMKAHLGDVTVLLGHNGAGKTTMYSMICGSTFITSAGYSCFKLASKLSGGEKRKLCLAMAFIGGSKILMLDEPTAGMDPHARKTVTEFITKQKQDRFAPGYVLSIAFKSENVGDSKSNTEELIKEHIESATMGELRGKQLQFNLPKEEQDKSSILASSSTGRRPDPDEVKVMRKMPTSEDVSQLRTFLSLISFYGNFVKDLHNLRTPLDAYTEKDGVYTWIPECQSSFKEIKAILNSDLLLAYYNPNLPIIMAAETPNHEIGASFSHHFPSLSEKVVYHTSR
ncbi:ABC transporter, ATP-binding protein, partial [Teladorsagia circumcincta]